MPPSWCAETVRKSVSEVALKSKSFTNQKDSRKTQTCQNLSCSADAPLDQEPHPSHLPNSDCQASFFLSEVEQEAEMASDPKDSLPFPDGFEPLRSDQPAGRLHLELSPVFKNPFMSPLLAPDSMLKGLPPVHIVVSGAPIIGGVVGGSGEVGLGRTCWGQRVGGREARALEDYSSGQKKEQLSWV